MKVRFDQVSSDMWGKKRDLIDKYDSTANSYDSRYESIQKQKFSVVKEEIEGAEKVLDLGCGTGLFLEKITEKSDLVIGVDFSHRMLKEAQKRSKKSLLVAADADNLPFFDDFFDLILSLTLLQNMPDPEKTMSEMSRVLSPGGKVVVTVLKKKVSLSDMRKWFKSAGLEPSRMREIPKSEDILCIAR